MDAIERLFVLAEKAKNCGCMEVANAVFVNLLSLFFSGVNPGIKVEVETEDPNGDEPLEVYYDLVVLRYREQYICIPVPLLASPTALALYKAGQLVDRRTHTRRQREPSDEETRELWKEFADSMFGGTEEVVEQLHNHLESFDEDALALLVEAAEKVLKVEVVTERL